MLLNKQRNNVKKSVKKGKNTVCINLKSFKNVLYINTQKNLDKGKKDLNH